MHYAVKAGCMQVTYTLPSMLSAANVKVFTLDLISRAVFTCDARQRAVMLSRPSVHPSVRDVGAPMHFRLRLGLQCLA